MLKTSLNMRQTGGEPSTRSSPISSGLTHLPKLITLLPIRFSKKAWKLFSRLKTTL
jgi:hypothetical protein